MNRLDTPDGECPNGDYEGADGDSAERQPPRKPSTIIDLNKVRYARMVMYFYDKFERADKREQENHRAEVERENKKKW